MDNKPVLYMMIGLPGSGKTTAANTIRVMHGAAVLSSDDIRAELFESPTHGTEENKVVFDELHRRIINKLSAGESVVYDATNLNRKKRMQFLESTSNVFCYKMAFFVATPYEVCIERNHQRGVPVPDEYIAACIRRFEPPMKEEGFDEVVMHINGVDDDRYNIHTLFEGDCGINNFDQKNPNHSLTLGEHCTKTLNLVTAMEGRTKNLCDAACLHDIGKVLTQEYSEKKDCCIYYNHHNVGAYECIFYLENLHRDWEDILYVSNLIYYHMHPYMSWSQSSKARNRDRDFMGEQMYRDVCMLHKADKGAH